MRPVAVFVAAVPLVLAACGQATTGANGSASPTSTVVASPRASASASASPSVSTKPVELQITVPENGAKAGVNGIGWTVDVVARGTGPAMDKIKPGIRGGGSPGRNPSFPGLMVLLKSAQVSPGLNPNSNLAGLFQIIGLANTQGGRAGISSVNTTASTAESETVHATWFVQQDVWGSDADVELAAFVVEGDAPDTLSDKGSLKIVSNEVTVRFHINGGPTGSAPSGAPRPAASPTSTP